MATIGYSKFTFIIILGIVIFILAVLAIFKIKAWHDLKIRRELAEKKCKEYTKFGCDNAIKGREAVSNESSPIIGGAFAYDGQFPHMASIVLITRDNSVSGCGGTLISEYFVLTACHCVENVTSEEDVMLKMGSVYPVFNVNDRKGDKFRVSKIYRHSDYNPKTIVNDIALLKLNKKVIFNSYMRPICLNTALKGNLKNITGTGWGITSLNKGKPANKLLFVDLYIDNEAVKSACFEQFGRTRIEEYGICAGNPQRFKAEAQGDSGGPLQITNECVNTYEQIGIVSFGREDRENYELWPTVHTKVADYIPWIVDIVWPHEL